MSPSLSIVERALRATRETREIEFKSEFDPSHRGHWCEIIKDIMAIANSGGGIIVFGLDNKGQPTDSDLAPLLKLDPAHITDKIQSYTGVDYDEFEIRKEVKNSKPVVCMILEPFLAPILPMRPGTYEKEPGKQVSAFSAGVFYYRHGAKSDPGSTRDLERIINRNVRSIRQEWMSGVRKIVSAPKGSVVSVHPKEVRLSLNQKAQPFRLTENKSAPEFRLVNPNMTHPYRMKELLSVLNIELEPLPKKINVYDIRALLEFFGLWENIQLTYKPQFGPRIYSPEFISWIKDNVSKDRYFLRSVRTKLRRGQRRRL